MTQEEQNIKTGDRIRMHDDSYAHVIEVRKKGIVIQGDGILGFQPTLFNINMFHKVIYKLTPISKESFYWQIVFGDE